MECDLWTSIIIHEPPSGGCNSGHTHIHSNGEITEEEPAADEGVLGRARGLLHDVDIGGVETKGSGGESVCDEVHPEQLDRDECFRKPKSSSQENAVQQDEDLNVIQKGDKMLSFFQAPLFCDSDKWYSVLVGGYAGREVVGGCWHWKTLCQHQATPPPPCSKQKNPHTSENG